MRGGNWWLALSGFIITCAALAIALACRGELPAPKRYRTECVGVSNPPGVDFPARLRDSTHDRPLSLSERDNRSYAIARRFPTYAGYLYRGRFFLVSFTDTLVGRAQLDTIVRLENIENMDSLPFRLAQVRWNFAQLYDWFDYLSPRLMRNNKAWMLGLDLYANRIILYVSDTVARHHADSQLVAMNVPCGL